MDISEYCDFEFYDLVWYHPGGIKLDTTEATRKLCQWLGVSHRVGSSMSYWILTKAGKIISNTTVQHVIQTDFEDMETKAMIDEFNTSVNEWLNDENFYVEELQELPTWMMKRKLTHLGGMKNREEL